MQPSSIKRGKIVESYAIRAIPWITVVILDFCAYYSKIEPKEKAKLL